MGSTRYDYTPKRRVANVMKRGYPIDELLESDEPVQKALTQWLKSVDVTNPAVGDKVTRLNKQAWRKSHERRSFSRRNDRLKEVRLFGLAAAYATRPTDSDLIKLWKDCEKNYGGLAPLLAAWTGVFRRRRSK